MRAYFFPIHCIIRASIQFSNPIIGRWAFPEWWSLAISKGLGYFLYGDSAASACKVKIITKYPAALLTISLFVLQQYLPASAILVGLNIRKDVEWLKLQEGKDFASMIDLAGLYRVFNNKHNNWTAFGQEHLVKVLLGYDAQGEEQHVVLP